MKTWYVRWARSEAEAASLQADGWRVASWQYPSICHHNNYAILLERDRP